MRKDSFIQFSVILILFILYHFFYILFNQTGTINSDTIWSYSLSRDIVEGLNLSGFTFPPFYYFFDIIISFLPALLGNHILHATIVSPVNILIFILFFSSFYKSSFNGDYFRAAILLILSTTIVYFLFIILSLIFGNIFKISVYPLLIIKNYFFMQGNHGLSAVAALIISYLYYFKEIPLKKNSFLFFLIFIFSLSDFWFAVYFLPIVGVLFLLNPNKSLFKEVLYLTISSVLALILTYYSNEPLRGYSNAVGGYKILEIFKNIPILIGMLSMLFIMYIIPLCCVLFLLIKKNLSNFVKCISLGSIVSVFFIVVMEKFTFYNMRFCVFALLLNIILIFEVLKLSQINVKKISYMTLLFLILGCIQILTINITDRMRDESTHFDFRQEISCIKEINENKNYTIFSSYWPSKVIFESLNRNTNLVTKSWIYNPSWSKLFLNSKGVIIVKYKHYPDNVPITLVDAIENEQIMFKNLCNKKLILIDNYKINFELKFVLDQGNTIISRFVHILRNLIKF